MPRKCEIAGCDSQHLARGMCRAHYLRVYRGGTPERDRRGGPALERFWSYVAKGESDACWMWRGKEKRYGKLFRKAQDGGPILAHRFSYELHHGPIPDGMFVCHRCDTPKCVNPAHLFLGTPQDNMDDMHAKGRARPGAARGENKPQAKLTEAKVRELRARKGQSATALSKEYGVTTRTIYQIWNREIWQHVA